MKKAILFLSFIAMAMVQTLPSFADDKRSKNSEISSQQNAPLFKDGKGYYTYKQPVDISLPKGKVVIHYFYRYGCEICVNADDYLKQYARLHPESVELVRLPAFDKGNPFAVQMNAAFTEYGRPELSDKFLFESAGRKGEQSLVANNNAIVQWLKQNSVDVPQFYQIFLSEKVKQQVEQAQSLFAKFSPPVTPIAVLNGKYLLVQNTLYNDDYTYAVLDFLVDKLQQEQQVTGEK